MRVSAALAEAARRLAATSATPRLDAELLMAHALGISREAMLLGGRDATVPDGFDALVVRRLAHEPVAYITGRRAFWTIELEAGPGVLIPRPDSETLIEAALAHFGSAGPQRILDLGTGSGALLLAALSEWPAASGVGVDISEAALAIARANGERLGLGARADIGVGSWDAAGAGTFDLVLCNPPYIGTDEPLPAEVKDYEPGGALYAGADGLDAYRNLAEMLRLPPGGLACFEIGSTQAAAVGALFAARGFLIDVRRDLAGLDRCVTVRPFS